MRGELCEGFLEPRGSLLGEPENLSSAIVSRTFAGQITLRAESLDQGTDLWRGDAERFCQLALRLFGVGLRAGPQEQQLVLDERSHGKRLGNHCLFHQATQLAARGVEVEQQIDEPTGVG